MNALPPIAILAGGLGTRLGAETACRPKSLVDIHGRPFIAWQLELLRRRGARRIVILAGHLGDQIEAALGDGTTFGVSIGYSFDGAHPLGTGGALRRALPQLGDRFLLLYGDSYLDVDYAAVAARLGAPGVSGVMTVCDAAQAGVAPNVRVDGDRVSAYGSGLGAAARHVDYGLSGFVSGALLNFPSDRPYDLKEIFRSLIANDGLFATVVAHPFHEIGSPGGLRAVRDLLGRSRSPRS